MNSKAINITSAEKAGPYQLHLLFDDGTEQIVDFKEFLSHSRHPAIRAYLEERKFESYHLEYGELVWGDYDLCFPMTDLYHNQILHPASMEAAA